MEGFARSLPAFTVHLRFARRVSFGLLLLSCCLYFSYMAFESTGVVEHGDAIVHYEAARFAPQNPELYLDHWAKPLFTLLSSPFAQMGFAGMIVFNVLLFAVTACIIFVWAEERHVHWAWTVPLLLLSAPVYYLMVNAGMTEILFSTLLTGTVVLFLRGRFVAGAILFSFAIFSRPESTAILPVFLLYLLWEKQWRAIPFLATGFVLYGLAGGWFLGDFLWYIHNYPYPPNRSIYGHGELFHFVKWAPHIWGPVSLLVGILGASYLVFKRVTCGSREAFRYFVLLFLPGFVVLCVHSYAWWKGIHGSAGLIRVMATVTPLAVMLSLVLFGRVQQFIREHTNGRLAQYVFPVSGLALAIYLLGNNAHKNLLPIQEAPMQALTTQAAEWFGKEHVPGTVAYQDAYFMFKAGINPFDRQKTILLTSLDPADPTNSLKTGDYLVWESHFGPMEGKLPKQKLLDNPCLQAVKTFTPVQPITVYHGLPYEILIFRVK